MKDFNFEIRIRLLERQLRFQRCAIAVLMTAVVAVVGIGASSSDVANELKAKKVIILNDKGEQAVLLTSEKDGGVAAIFGPEGHIPVLIAAGRETGGELLIKATSGQNRVELLGDKDRGKVSVSSNGQMQQLGQPQTPK